VPQLRLLHTRPEVGQRVRTVVSKAHSPKHTHTSLSNVGVGVSAALSVLFLRLLDADGFGAVGGAVGLGATGGAPAPLLPLSPFDSKL
jgi:hypothetical protein